MLAFAQQKAKAGKASARFVLADMTDFAIDESVDFVLILLGSLPARNTADLISLFDSVSGVLKPGGLFFLDWCLVFTPSQVSVDSWEMVRDSIKVKITYQTKLINPVEQVFVENLTLEVDDDGDKKEFQKTELIRKIYPQEFLLFIAARNDFEFVGWWNNWDLSQDLGETQEISRPIKILRRV